jgi:hypothetical protein
MEAVMKNLENEFINIHQETIQREAHLRQLIKQSETPELPLSDRLAASLGDWLIRVGTRLRDRTYNRLTTEEASAPSFLIML